MFRKLFGGIEGEPSLQEEPKEMVGTGEYKYSCRVELFSKRAGNLDGVEKIEGTAGSLEEAKRKLHEDKK